MESNLTEHRIYLRPAGMDDIGILIHWDEKPHVQDSGSDDDWHWRNELERQHSCRKILIAELDGTPYKD